MAQDDIKNIGSLDCTRSFQTKDLSFSLYEDAGVATSNSILGIEALASLDYSSQYETYYVILFPLQAYIDMAFTNKNRSVYRNGNGLKLYAGGLDTVSNYGEMFPLQGAGFELYFRREKTFAKIIGQIGNVGALNSGSEEVYKYQAMYDGVSMLFGSAILGLDFDHQKEFVLEGVAGKFDKEDGYWGDWDEDGQYIDGPDAYDRFHGASLQFGLRKQNFEFGLAYYYLSRAGENHFNNLEDYGFHINDSIEKNSHRLAGNASLIIFQHDDTVFRLGGQFNYYKSDKTNKFSTPSQIFTTSSISTKGDSIGSSLSNDRSYVNGYLSIEFGALSLELGGGYIEELSRYRSSCDMFCLQSRDETVDDNWNFYLASTLQWGGP